MGAVFLTSNTFSCKRCRKIFIAEEFDAHNCEPKLIGVKDMEFDYFYISENGKAVIIMSMDGTNYRFVKRERD